jgi:hypothetical protein
VDLADDLSLPNAAEDSFLDIVTLLVERGADLGAKEEKEILHWIRQWLEEKWEVVEYLGSFINSDV